MYSPNYKANAGILLRLNQYNFSLIGHYNSEQYTNNENTELIDSYYTIDFKVSTQLFKKLELGLGIQNILDYKKKQIKRELETKNLLQERPSFR